MTRNNDAFAPEVLELLRAYVDAVLLAEPLQLNLWKSAGVTLTQLRILRVLQQEGARSATDLAQAAGLSAPSLTRVLDRMEELELVVRVADPSDRRRVCVELLERGRQLIGGRNILQGTALARAAASLGPSERRLLIDALHAFVSRVVALQESESEAESQS
jgi:DNA-binding MarR family transcriptional regulator